MDVPVLAKTRAEMPGRQKEADHKRSSARPGEGTLAGPAAGEAQNRVLTDTMQAAVEKLQETMANLDHQWRRHLRLRRTRPKRREIRQVGWRGQRVHRPTRPELHAGAGAGNRLLRPTTTRRRAPATPSRPWKNYVPPPEVARALGMNQLQVVQTSNSGASYRGRPGRVAAPDRHRPGAKSRRG